VKIPKLIFFCLILIPFAIHAGYLNNSKFSNLRPEKQVYVEVLDNLIYQVSLSLKELKETKDIDYIIHSGLIELSNNLHSLVLDMIDPKSPRSFCEFCILQIRKTKQIAKDRKHIAKYFIQDIEAHLSPENPVYPLGWEGLLKKYIACDDFIESAYIEHFLSKFLSQLKLKHPETFASILNGYIEKYSDFSILQLVTKSEDQY
jgi:hypothetical protein